MKKNPLRKYTQLGIHIEGIELDPKKRKIFEAAMASELQKLLHEMDNVKRYGFIKVIPDLKGHIPEPFPFPHGVVADLDGRLLSIINKTHDIR